MGEFVISNTISLESIIEIVAELKRRYVIPPSYCLFEEYWEKRRHTSGVKSARQTLSGERGVELTEFFRMCEILRAARGDVSIFRRLFAYCLAPSPDVEVTAVETDFVESFKRNGPPRHAGLGGDAAAASRDDTRQLVADLTESTAFNGFIIFSVVVNSISLCLFYKGMSSQLTTALDWIDIGE